MSELWKIIQNHLDEYGVREAAFARLIGSAPQTVNSWKKRGLKQLPDESVLRALSDVTKTSYADILTAVLRDINYVKKDELPASLVTTDDLIRLGQVSAMLRVAAPDPDEHGQYSIADMFALIGATEDSSVIVDSVASKAFESLEQYRDFFDSQMKHGQADVNFRRHFYRHLRSANETDEQESRTQESGAEFSGTGSEEGQSGAPIAADPSKFKDAAATLGERARNVVRDDGKSEALSEQDKGSQLDYVLAQRKGLTQERQRRLLETEPEDEPQGAASEDGA